MHREQMHFYVHTLLKFVSLLIIQLKRGEKVKIFMAVGYYNNYMPADACS